MAFLKKCIKKKRNWREKKVLRIIISAVHVIGFPVVQHRPPCRSSLCCTEGEESTESCCAAAVVLGRLVKGGQPRLEGEQLNRLAT